MLLKSGEALEGLRTIVKVADEHPDYGFANAAVLSLAVNTGDMERAREILRRVRLPRRIDPREYLIWLRAQHQYLAAIGKADLARNVEQMIRRIEREFGC